jgi:hypothetical protein
MIAKEKAEELFDKMAFEVCGTDAKICALIAVDEIIKEFRDDEYAERYWQEVKQEIQKL